MLWLHELDMRNDVSITPELVAEHGLKPDEYQRIVSLIGREPSLTELGIFSAMPSSRTASRRTRRSSAASSRSTARRTRRR
jgi:phosphoribosylformylglycinamidine synthase